MLSLQQVSFGLEQITQDWRVILGLQQAITIEIQTNSLWLELPRG